MQIELTLKTLNEQLNKDSLPFLHHKTGNIYDFVGTVSPLKPHLEKHPLFIENDNYVLAHDSENPYAKYCVFIHNGILYSTASTNPHGKILYYREGLFWLRDTLMFHELVLQKDGKYRPRFELLDLVDPSLKVNK